MITLSRMMRGVALLAATATVAACGLPRVGPSKQEIFAGSVMRQGDAFVLTVTDRVNAIAGVTPANDFAASFRGAGRISAETIRPGDTLSLTIWENVDDGIVVARGQNATVLDAIQVDENGYIFVPYAGRIRAAGNSPDAVRSMITQKLAQQTPDPQVQVRREAGDGATVTLIGTAGGQGVRPITRSARNLSSMVALAGGIAQEAEDTRITLIRNGRRGTIYFEDLVQHPENDVALRDGDTIVLEKDDRSFTALGATGRQTEVPFTTASISAIEAIAQVGGLNPALADPTGVFVFRNEPEEIAERLTGLDLTGTQRVIYVLDLTVPNGVFLARDFAIRNDDTVFVTEAPFVQVNKTVAAITGTLGSAANTANMVGVN